VVRGEESEEESPPGHRGHGDWEAEKLLAGGGGRGLDGAVAAFAFLIIEKGFEEARAIEIGPESFGDKDFSVGDLPKKEVADAHFAAGANEEIGIGKIGGVEMSREIFLGDEFWRLVAVAIARGQDGVHSIDNFGAATVVEGDVQHHAGVLGEGLGGFASIALNGFREFVGAAEEAHADIISLKQRHLLADIFAQELHEEFDFGFGAAPIFDRESVKGERFDVQTRGGFDGHAGGLRASAVSRDTGKMAFLSPAAVAVHDDRDVARKAGEIEFFEEMRFFGGDGAKSFELRAGVRHGEFPGKSSLRRKVNTGIRGNANEKVAEVARK
jgi:hypothetical protein